MWVTNRRAWAHNWWKLLSAVVVLLFASSLMIGVLPSLAQAQESYPAGSLPDVGKKINQLIWPTFGYPAIQTRGSEMTIEWDWRKSIPDASRPSFATISNPGDWSIWVTTSVSANVQHYNGSTNNENDWYNYQNTSHPYGYGHYENPVHTVINTRALDVKSLKREASTRWPEVFGQTGFEVDKITVEVPDDVPLDLYDLHVKCNVPGATTEDQQPHALNVVKEIKENVKILQISDIHVFGQEIENGTRDLTGTGIWTGMQRVDFSSFELREPRPGTPNRTPPLINGIDYGYHTFPLDKDGNGNTNEGAIYLQEELQAINLINPDFVVFTGDGVFDQSDWNIFPKADSPGGGSTTGDMGSECRKEMTWFYDELLALDVPIFCVPGNHDGYCKDISQGGQVQLHDDGLEIWQDLFGPAYYSWDYGDNHFLALNGMDWPKTAAEITPSPYPPFVDFPDRSAYAWNIIDVIHDMLGMPIDTNQPAVPIIVPHRWHGQLRANGDVWQQGNAPPGSGLRWDPKDINGYQGQLGWIRDDLASNMGKKLRGVFLHHDPLENIGSDPKMWDDTNLFLTFKGPSGRGEGSQSLVNLMKQFDVAFEASGHDHNDWIGSVPWNDGTGNLRAINTAAAEIPVDGEGLALLVSHSDSKYAGYRLITLDNGQVADWGFAGQDNNPDKKYSIPGWAGLQIGAGNVNDYMKYRQNRPVLQWMEQNNSPDRAPVTPGSDGTFNQTLPLNQTGPYDDVTCKVKNTLNQTGAVLNLTDCRIEFPMKSESDHSYYQVENGKLLEQYNTDSGQRMVTVLTDSNAGTSPVTPVRVHAVGSDQKHPVVDNAKIDDGALKTQDLNVKLDLAAHDVGGAGMLDYCVSNNADFSGAARVPYTGGPISTDWKLSEGGPGPRDVYVEFRDAAMPGNTTVKHLTITLLSSPTITSITPNSLGNGKGNKSASVTISGTDFVSRAKVTLTRSGQKAVKGSKVIVSSPTVITCNFNLTKVAVGAWDVVVTNPDGGTGTLTGGLTVNPHPVITSIDPISAYTGNPSVSLTITGTDFVSGATVKLTKGRFAPIEATIDSVASNEIKCHFNLTGAQIGAWKVLVTNLDGGIHWAPTFIFKVTRLP